MRKPPRLSREARRGAFPDWAATPIAQRRRLLDALGDAIRANLDSLKRLLTMEQGTPLTEAVAGAEVGDSVDRVQRPAT